MTMSKYLSISVVLALSTVVESVGLGDVKHVVMLMMENRSFQHVSNSNVLLGII